MFDLFRHAGWVAWPLGICSVLGLGIILERLITLARLKQLEERAFMVLQLALEKGDDDLRADPEIRAAPIAQVVGSLAGLRGQDAGTIREAAEIALAQQRLRFRRYLGTLATIGSNAPFIGLFGTVLGVMAAFQGMSKSGMTSESMASGISEALSATALGLLVAIPSVMAYNYFLGRVQTLMLHLQGHAAQLAPLIAERPEDARREKQEV